MPEISRIEMPDGNVIFARIEQVAEFPSLTGDGTEVTKVGFRETRDLLKVENLRTTVRSVAESVRGSVHGLRADKVGVEFGLELVAGTGGVLAVLVSGGGKVTVKVKLDWNLDGSEPDPDGDPDPDPDDPAPQQD